MPKGSVREDRRPQSWKTMKLNPAKAGHAKRPPTPRKRNRKEPDSKVSQNNSSLAQAGSFGDRRVNEDHPARFGPRCVFIPFEKNILFGSPLLIPYREFRCLAAVRFLQYFNRYAVFQFKISNNTASLIFILIRKT